VQPAAAREFPQVRRITGVVWLDAEHTDQLTNGHARALSEAVWQHWWW
jgi:hypothetical protein